MPGQWRVTRILRVPVDDQLYDDYDQAQAARDTLRAEHPERSYATAHDTFPLDTWLDALFPEPE